MSILQALVTTREQEQDAALRRYIKLLRANDPKAVGELKSLMATLGKSQAEVADDMRLMNTAANHIARIKAGENIDAPVQQAHDAVQRCVEETMRIQQERRVKHFQLQSEVNRLSQIQTGAQQSLQQLRQMKNEHRELLADFEIPGQEE